MPRLFVWPNVEHASRTTRTAYRRALSQRVAGALAAQQATCRAKNA